MHRVRQVPLEHFCLSILYIYYWIFPAGDRLLEIVKTAHQLLYKTSDVKSRFLIHPNWFVDGEIVVYSLVTEAQEE